MEHPKPEAELVDIGSMKVNDFPFVKESHETIIKQINEHLDKINGMYETTKQEIKKQCAGNPEHEAIWWERGYKHLLNVLKKATLEQEIIERDRYKKGLEQARLSYQPFN